MFILLVSDTHGNIWDLKRVISDCENVDLVIHLGDMVKDVYKIKSEFPNIPFEYVAGNNDWSMSEPDEKFIEICGKKIFIAHGHTYGVKTSTKKIVEKGRQLKADVICFGHTHLADEFFSGHMHVINPGSLGRASVYQGPTFCEIKIGDGKLNTTFRTIV